MLTEQGSARLRFLTDAAHLLSASAPETSAYLMGRRNALMVESDVPLSDLQREHVCTCCGHIILPGQGGSTLRIEPQGVKRKHKHKSGKSGKRSSARANAASKQAPPPKARSDGATATGISKVITCGSCGRRTTIQMPAPRPISRRTKTKTRRAPDVPARTTLAAEPPKLSANASSKKRAKNRKAGLQALLDQKQASSGSGSGSGLGLSLADFMAK